MSTESLERELADLRAAAFDAVLASRNFGLHVPPIADRVKQFAAAHAAMTERVQALAEKVSAT